MSDDALSAAPSHPAVAGTAARLPAALAIAVVGLQIAYPLVHGTARDHLTVWIVATLAAAAVTHAAMTRGPVVAVGLLLVTAVPGYLIELLGVHTGFPFGSYTYSARLGPRWFGVPPLIGLAWTMLAWPAALAARRLVRHRLARVLIGAWALAAADVFLDPQLVAAGGWTWQSPDPHLPGVPAVPLTNFAGWLLVALALSAAVQRLAAANTGAGVPDVDDTVPVALYLWLYVGWVVALAVFLDLAAAAAWGALAMGAIAVPVGMRWQR